MTTSPAPLTGSAPQRTITYRFFSSQTGNNVVSLNFDQHSHRLVLPADAPQPDWATLSCHRCPNCTLPDSESHCPAALGIGLFMPLFSNTVSHEKTVVEVETPQRTIVTKTTFQSALASLIGLVCATSGCPRTLFLRPMARFHLPFADETETLFRAFSSWLLMALIRQRQTGNTQPLSLDGLKEHYQQISIVNSHLAQRLRRVATRDAALNAIIILELFAQIAPDNIDGNFEDLAEIITYEG